MRNKRLFQSAVLITTVTVMTASTISGCGKNIPPADTAYVEEKTIEESEINLTKLLSAVNDSVIEHCGTGYTLTPFAQYKLSDETLTDDLSEVDKESLEDNKLTAYILFQIPQQGNKFENKTAQHYIEAVVDVSTYQVLSLSESAGSIEDDHWTKIF